MIVLPWNSPPKRSSSGSPCDPARWGGRGSGTRGSWKRDPPCRSTRHSLSGSLSCCKSCGCSTLAAGLRREKSQWTKWKIKKNLAICQDMRSWWAKLLPRAAYVFICFAKFLEIPWRFMMWLFKPPTKATRQSSSWDAKQGYWIQPAVGMSCSTVPGRS